MRRNSSSIKNDLEGVESFLSFRAISGYTVAREEIIKEIHKLPLDGVLGFLAGLSLQMIQSDLDFYSSKLQGGYLNYALVDDFPRKIQSSYKRYIPGRAPLTGNNHIFVHEQNMAWLCHAALLYAKADSNTPDITYNLSCRLFRLLLIINDFLNERRMKGPFDLARRREFTLNWLRYSQFNRLLGNPVMLFAKLARHKIIMCDILPNYFPDVHAKFIDALGISLQRYFEVITLLISHFYTIMKTGTHWLARDTVTSNIPANCSDIETILDAWSITPEKYKTKCAEWRSQHKNQDELPLYDYVPLRATPFIEARSKELVCAVPSFIFAKIEDEPFFILSDFLSGTELNRFHTALGLAYEKYANRLVKRIANNDKAGEWSVIHSPTTKKDEELTDIYLQRNGTGIMFEHKGKRPGTEFLRGGEGDRVMGPSAGLLSQLDGGNAVDQKKCSKHDEGLITGGMWQQSKAGPKMIDYAQKHFGEKPNYVFPIITMYCSLVVDQVVRKAYLNPYIQTAPLYQEEFWKTPQWINVADLEALAVMSESGELDFEVLLNEKVDECNDRRFDYFLYQFNKGRYIGTHLLDEYQSILDGSELAFFRKENS